MRWQEIKTQEKIKNNLIQRSVFLSKIRGFFAEKGYVEIDSPLLVAKPNMEPNLDIFETILRNPEFALKKILVAGLPKIYQMSKCFRNNEPWNENHNPEFTLLEWYETGINYFNLMDQVEKLVRFISNQQTVINYQGKEINLISPWIRMSMQEAWAKYAGVDLNNYLTYDTMRTLVLKKGYTVTEDDSWEDLFFKIFLTEIELRFSESHQPVFLYDFPVSMAAMSRIKKEDPRYAERFELYIGGLEIANAYGELTDAVEQEKRFLEDQKEQEKKGLVKREIDEDFLQALKSGVPECAGIALGVDRLIMLLTNSKDIAEVVPFCTKEIF
ncbi:MAG: EF-P lysine aminoacylase EpmA [Candidatus Magasanikbacteria bacterium]|nr:EF-P lysine aminoacylase EpmA [Candidatus Magasanikbacteria bacterium]